MTVRVEHLTEPIPGYRLLERLGRGGFGEVWKAEAPGGLLKAIKFVYGDLRAKEEGVAAEQELKALSRVKTVRHPFILSLERYDIVDGQLLIVMELADRNLYDRFVECRGQGLPGIPRDELLRYMDEIAEALDLMNSEHQLQHLDIKPQNLFLVHNHIKVADFGLVKDLEGMRASVTGGVTPLYAAPETFDGWVSRYCDQYSLAIVYQELLTGQRPFSGTNARQLVLQHLTAEPNLAPLPAGDRAAIGRALAKKADERHSSCAEMVRCLRTGTPADSAVARPLPPPSGPAGREDTDSECRTNEQRISRQDLNLDDSAEATNTARSFPQFNSAPRSAVTDSSARTHSPPREIQGDGVLFPALVVGVGEMALGAMQRLREGLYTQFGSLGPLPHVRLLYLDTDPDGLRKAVEGRHGAALMGQEILLTRLNRPSHYLRPRDGLVAIESWFDSKMLFRIPRSQVTNGLRALGRLAFIDNYHLIAERLQEELEGCTAPEALSAADRLTGLGIRTNRPRVYVVCGLAGGTGSGMFLDLAYVVRAQLRLLGYTRPELVGLFLLPPVEARAARTVAVGNAYAALTELNHFSSPGVSFVARYDNKEPPLTDPEAPFNRCHLLPVGMGGDALAQASGLAGGFLFQELITPLGHTADRKRETVTTLRPNRCPEPGGLHYSTFGLYRFSWPRRSLVGRLARQLSRRLVQRWTSKEVEALQSAVQAWVADQWSKQAFAPEGVIDQLEAACEAALGETPASSFATLTNRLVRRGPSSVDVDPATVATIVAEIEQLVGRPDDEVKGQRSATLVDTLDQAVRSLTARYEQRLAELAVCLVEQPDFRLAGAEEALRQLSGNLQQVIEDQSALAEQFVTQAAEMHARVRTLLEHFHGVAAGKRKPSPLASVDLVETLHTYPRLRYQALLLQRVTTIYRSMLGNCPEYLREFSFCRARLNDLLRALENPAAADRPEVDLGPGRQIFPAGCQSLDEAAQKFLLAVTPAELLEFDQQIQAIIRRQFKALVHVCMSSGSLLRDLELALLQHASPFMEARLGLANVAEIYLEQHATDEAIAEGLTRSFEEARPAQLESPVASPQEVRILAVPMHPAGERLRDVARQALPGTEVVTTLSMDDLVFYREQSSLPLADLPQLGSIAREAYNQMAAAEHFTPHNRMDIAAWQPKAQAK